MKNTLTICAVFKNEAQYLDEWLTFHSNLGVERFVLFDDESNDHFQEVLEPWVRAKRVEVWPAKGRKQLKLYNVCLRKERFKSRWLGFIDIDEFLWTPSHKSIPEALNMFASASAIMIGWRLFGSSGHKKPPVTSVIASFSNCLDYLGADVSREWSRVGTEAGVAITGRPYHGKSIINPRRVISAGVHLPLIFVGKIWNELGESFGLLKRFNKAARQSFWKRTPTDIFRINHYWSRSLEELENKVIKRVSGSFHRHEKIDQAKALKGFFAWDDFLNSSTDLSIQKTGRESMRSRPNFVD